MGFNFRSLTSSALVSRNHNSAAATEKDVADVPASYAAHTTSIDGGRPDEKLGAPRGNGEDVDSDEELNKIDTNAEQGVQTVQAMTMVWSKRSLYLTFVWIWIIQFCLSFTSGSVSTMTPYATSQWKAHSLTALTSVISSVISGLWKLPYAKIMNIWGRPYALIFGVGSTTLGLILMAACKNVQMYCAAMTFYYVGYNSIDFSITVFVADTTKLKNRGLFIGYVASPWLITTWVYGYAVNSIMAPGGIGLAWGFGVLSIVIPVVCTPLIIMFIIHQNKAEREGLIQPRPSRGFMYYLKEFDVVGLLILATGLALFLLSFNLYSLQKNGFRSPLIICFIIIGFLLVVVFALWEKYWAPVTFIPWHLLKNRTVLFTYALAFAFYIGWYVWDSYFYSLLVVLFNQTIPHATYIANIYTMGSCFISLVYGLVLRYNGRLKWWTFFWGVPLTVLGVGLMIKFRQPGEGVGYVAMCMVFISLGGGVIVISEQTTLMAVSKQQDFPALLACESMVIFIGGAIGQTIAGAIWTGVFPARLRANLPPDAMDNFTNIYGVLNVQSGYPWGSPTRDAINLSYAQTQRYMLIAAVCIYSTSFVSVLLWQDVDVKKQKQRTVGLL
ncbi:hypothetical protein CC80DRAFT_589160 [Byssothecium circinans]|uniref:Siderophore iron transporter mirB n=1 Tax=Byssothecium circinans TaxID=147558 RepID=A0A6A5UA72_9PLEO|nr:hypothetical protein CC80DRAFT_589160 [Byssothecium circinans]